MKAHTTTPEEFESTYAMLVRSEKEERNVSETLVYAILFMTAVISIWHLALQPVTVPSELFRGASAPIVASTHQPTV